MWLDVVVDWGTTWLWTVVPRSWLWTVVPRGCGLWCYVARCGCGLWCHVARCGLWCHVAHCGLWCHATVNWGAMWLVVVADCGSERHTVDCGCCQPLVSSLDPTGECTASSDTHRQQWRFSSFNIWRIAKFIPKKLHAGLDDACHMFVHIIITSEHSTRLHYSGSGDACFIVCFLIRTQSIRSTHQKKGY